MPIDIDAFRRREQAEDARSHQEMEDRRRQRISRDREAYKTLSRGCRPIASGREYSHLVREWVKDGGVPMHSYNYPFSNSDASGRHKYWIAERDFILPCLEGASSVIVFVPDGIKYETTGGIGHNILILEGGKSAGIGYGPPIFSDT